VRFYQSPISCKESIKDNSRHFWFEIWFLLLSNIFVLWCFEFIRNYSRIILLSLVESIWFFWVKYFFGRRLFRFIQFFDAWWHWWLPLTISGHDAAFIMTLRTHLKTAHFFAFFSSKNENQQPTTTWVSEATEKCAVL
jgi:hypothetical protein